MLEIEPDSRYSAVECLQHEFFSNHLSIRILSFNEEVHPSPQILDFDEFNIEEEDGEEVNSLAN